MAEHGGPAGSVPTRASLEADAGRHAVLFDEVRIGPKVAPNRFYAVPYSTGWGMHQLNLERAHRRTRAEGGWGVVCTGQVLFEREANVDFLDMLLLYDDDDMRALAPLADEIHSAGSLAGLELGHPGALATSGVWRVPPRGPSQLLTDAMFLSQAIPQEMTPGDIRGVRNEWVAAARRARGAGFDIVYVQAAHSSLAMQFLAPYYNQRTDEYGGALENRARFLLELLADVRDAIGHDTAIACRFAIEGLGPGGIGIDEALEVMQMSDDLVDLWDISIGGFANAGVDLTPSRLFPEGASVAWSARAKEVTAKPVVGSGRFTDPDKMAELVQAGTLDFIGAARPGIADPFIPRKLASAEPHSIRRCIGSNRCAYSQALGNLSCSQNPTAGEEYRRGWHPEQVQPTATSERSVLVVGAGPAGLECAITLARRGFERVHLVEAADEVGGHMRWFSKLPGFETWNEVVSHRRALLEQFPAIELTTGVRLDAQAALAYQTAAIVIATGSQWATEAANFFTNDPAPGADAAASNVLTPEQLILEGKPIAAGSRVVIYDCQADHIALGVAQYLQAAGHEVEIASPFADVAMRIIADGTSHALKGEIGAAGGRFRPAHFLVAATGTSAIFLDETMSQAEVPCDALMLITRRSSRDALYHDLEAIGESESAVGAVYRIGDCVAPQDLADAVFSGHRLAREIDAENPAVAKPALRV